MKKIMTILSVLSILSISAQKGEVGELVSIPKETSKKWVSESGKSIYETFNGIDYEFDYTYDARSESFVGGEFYKIAANGTKTKISSFVPKKGVLLWEIGEFGGSLQLFCLDVTSRFFAFDLIKGVEKEIDVLKFSAQMVYSPTIDISEDKTKVGIVWITAYKRSISVYDYKFNNLYKHANFSIPASNMFTTFNEFTVFNDGTSIAVMGDIRLAGVYATKSGIETFFTPLDKLYTLDKLSDVRCIEINGKKLIVVLARNDKAANAFLMVSDLDVKNLKFSMSELSGLDLKYPYPTSTKSDLIYLEYRGIYEVGNNYTFQLVRKSPMSSFSPGTTYDAVFIKTDKQFKVNKITTLYFKAVKGDKRYFRINDKIAYLYNDAKNHLANEFSKDFADFSQISDRKGNLRESAIYAATYDLESGEIKKQLLLESDSKSNLINRFFAYRSKVNDNVVDFDVIQGLFIKGAGKDDLEWKSYQFTFTK